MKYHYLISKGTAIILDSRKVEGFEAPDSMAKIVKLTRLAIVDNKLDDSHTVTIVTEPDSLTA